MIETSTARYQVHLACRDADHNEPSRRPSFRNAAPLGPWPWPLCNWPASPILSMTPDEESCPWGGHVTRHRCPVLVLVATILYMHAICILPTSGSPASADGLLPPPPLGNL